MSGVLDAVALERFLETLAQTSGYDFRGYKHGALWRRLKDLMTYEQIDTLEELDRQVAADPRLRERLTYALTVHHVSFFRDASFWQGFRSVVIPLLRTYPSLRVWTPACGTGEESYTLAICLEEAGLLKKARVYATPQHPFALDSLRDGLYRPEIAPQAWSTVENGVARMRKELIERMVCSAHNLVTDASPNEFHLILCRDVLSRFDTALQERVLSLFHASLCPFGLLVLGEHDPRPSGRWEPVDGVSRVYRRIS